jgi:hypothetical protein
VLPTGPVHAPVTPMRQALPGGTLAGDGRPDEVAEEVVVAVQSGACGGRPHRVANIDTPKPLVNMPGDGDVELLAVYDHTSAGNQLFTHGNSRTTRVAGDTSGSAGNRTGERALLSSPAPPTGQRLAWPRATMVQ